jgi:hypothetical protein
MTRLLRAPALAALAALTISLAACAGGGADAPAQLLEDPVPSDVVVTPENATLATGESLVLSAAVDGEPAAEVVWSVEAPEGGSVSADGVYTAPAAPGVYAVVATSATDASRWGRATIAVFEPVASGAVSATPAALNLESVYVGQTRVLPVVVKNVTGAPVTIASARASGGGLSHRLGLPRTLAPGASAWFGVEWTPASAGALAGAIHLEDGSGAPLATIPVTGAAAALDASNSVDVTAFGAVGDGVTDDRAAFQAAANAAAGKVLFVPRPPGGQHYKLTGVVHLRGSVVGAPGGERPVIRMYGATGVDNPGGASPHTIFYFKDSTAPTVITGLHLDGGRFFPAGTNVYGMAEQSHGIALQNVSNLYIENNVIENMQGDNVLIGGEPGAGPCSNVRVIANVLRHPMRCAVFPGDTRGLRIYFNVIKKLVEYQSTIDFEPNLSPQSSWDAEIAYNDFDETLSWDRAVMTSNYVTNIPAPGGDIRIHDNYGQAGRYSFFLDLVAPGTASKWVNLDIQQSILPYP